MSQFDLAQYGRPRSMWLMLVLFFVTVFALQSAWQKARGTPVEAIVIDMATVGTAVAVINAWTPEAHAMAVGSRIRAPGGGINILNGCEGTEVLFLLIAAMVAYPMSWRFRLVGVLGGTCLVFVLNQIRILALFYSYRSDRDLFNQLHGLVAPMALIVITIGFFLLLMWWDRPAHRVGQQMTE